MTWNTSSIPADEFTMSAIVLALSLVVLMGSTAVSCLKSENIIRGQVAEVNQFPYQVSLQEAKRHKCGGTLIQPNLVLTAAHCFYDNELKVKKAPYVVVAGSISIYDFSHRIVVAKIYLHKKYAHNLNGINWNDIAVVRLKSSFDISLPGIALASLPERYDDFDGQEATVSGFGWNKISMRKNIESNVKERVGLSLGLLRYETVDIEQCNVKLPIFVCGRIRSATKKNAKGLCDGDSGGPLVIGKGNEAKVIGIVSTGPPDCNQLTGENYFTRVSKYLSFIESAMNDTPGLDTVVQYVKTKIYDIPTLDLKAITTSPEIQEVLDFLQVYHPIYTLKKKRCIEATELLDTLEAEVKELQHQKSDPSSTMYVAKYHEYDKAYDLREAKLDDIQPLKDEVLETIDRLNELIKTGKLLHI